MTKSRVFFLCCLFFTAGVALASFWRVNYSVLFFALAAFMAFFIFYDDGSVKEKSFIILAVIFFLGGFFRYATFEDVLKKDNDVSFLADRDIKIEAIVDQEPEFTQKSQRLVVVSEKVRAKGVSKDVSGRTLAVLPPYPRYSYGDKILIEGVLKEPKNTEEFSEKDYLAKDRIFSQFIFPKISVISTDNGSFFWKNIYSLKNKIRENLGLYLVEPQASLLAGLLMGARETLPKDFKEDLSKSGTSHIVALSGYNITIVASAVMGLLYFFGATPTIGFWATIFFVFLFTVFCGAQASLVRAAIMGVLVLVAKKEGRIYDIKNALLFAAASMIFINPKILRFDVSFQLSFLATLGLVYLSPVFKKKLSFVPEFFRLRETLSETLGAQFAVLPMLVAVFGSFSAISPISNILVLSVVPLTMLLGFIFLVFSFFAVLPAKIFGFLSWILLSYEIFVIKKSASLPFSSINSPFWALLFMVFVYFGVAVLIFPKKLKIFYEKIIR